MEQIKDENLKAIRGGLLKIALGKVAIGVGIGISFIIGMINGYQNPLPCNK